MKKKSLCTVATSLILILIMCGCVAAVDGQSQEMKDISATPLEIPVQTDEKEDDVKSNNQNDIGTEYGSLEISVDEFIEKANTALEFLSKEDLSFPAAEKSDSDELLYSRIGGSSDIIISYETYESGEIGLVHIWGNNMVLSDLLDDIRPYLYSTMVAAHPNITVLNVNAEYINLYKAALDTFPVGWIVKDDIELSMILSSGSDSIPSSLSVTISPVGYIDNKQRSRDDTVSIETPQDFTEMVTYEETTISLGEINWETNDEDIFRVPITINNTGDSKSYVVVGYNILDPDEVKLANPNIYYDDSLSIATTLEPGEEITRHLYFPYKGDGEYYFEFGKLPLGNQRIAIAVTK